MSRSGRLISVVALALVSALVSIAAIVPAVVASSVVVFLAGHVVGLGNETIGVLALVASVPVGFLAVRWIWLDLKGFVPSQGSAGAPQ